MADTKITALTALTGADPANDVIPIVDVSDTTMAASGTTKKISVNNILGASGTATLASATITGDLTVDTSTLKVDSANNRVGIGTASPSASFHTNSDGVASGAGWTAIGRFNNVAQSKGIDIGYNPSNNNGVFTALTAGATSGFEFWSFDGSWSNRMTLNSTGLGVGVSPGSAIGNLQVGGSSNANLYVQQGTDTIRMGVRASGRTGIILDSSNATYTNRAWYLDNVGSSGSLVIGRQGLDVITFDNSGNCGIGVTPSAWRSTVRALQIGGVGALYGSTATTGAVSLSRNAYDSATGGTYLSNDEATLYEQDQLGRHVWYNAPAGTGAISWQQAMTLDASGRLILLASTTTPATLNTNGQLTFTATSDTNLRFSYRGSDGVTRVANLTLA